jgi:ribulose-phosphate 3-epimerase
MVKIAPSILSADFAEEVQAAEKAGADLIHVDVMDGHFVPNITIGPPVVKALKKIATRPLDVHLMIENADRYIRDFADSGADILTVHAEACTHLHRTIQNIRECGVKAAVTINPATPLTDIEFIIPYVDMVLLMSVNPGFGGQKFIPEVLAKIRSLKKMMKEKSSQAEIQVDGGVNVDNVAEVVSAGVDIVVMGSAFYNSDDYSRTVKTIREKCCK